jgi:hypothetical protein
MSNDTLLTLQQNIANGTSKSKIKKLIEDAESKKSSILNEKYSSKEYQKNYSEYTSGGSGSFNLLKAEEKRLEKQANLWSEINRLIEVQGKNKVLGGVNYKIEQIRNYTHKSVTTNNQKNERSERNGN